MVWLNILCKSGCVICDVIYGCAISAHTLFLQHVKPRWPCICICMYMVRVGLGLVLGSGFGLGLVLGFGLGLGFAMICSGHGHLCLKGCGNGALFPQPFKHR